MKYACLTMLAGGLIFWTSCATTKPLHPDLPAETPMNKGAGRGDELFVTLRLEDGKDLLFLIDTGASGIVLDKSLELKLGHCFWTHRERHVRYGMKSWKLFRAPKLFWGNTRLPTGSWLWTSDLSNFSDIMARSTYTNRPIMGILGMSCLKHYCFQLDFTAGKMRFLDRAYLNKKDWGDAFPLASLDGCFSIRQNLVGAKNSRSLLDTGYNFDGWLVPKLFKQWTNQLAISTNDEARNASLNGSLYPEINLGPTGENSFNGIGLHFLSRHLVTFDFPERTLYLKRTNAGPIEEEDSKAAIAFLRTLKQSDRQPGWSKTDNGQLFPYAYPISGILDVQKNGDSAMYHYQVERAAKDGPWNLRRAWQTDAAGNIIKEFPIQ